MSADDQKAKPHAAFGGVERRRARAEVSLAAVRSLSEHLHGSKPKRAFKMRVSRKGNE